MLMSLKINRIMNISRILKFIPVLFLFFTCISFVSAQDASGRRDSEKIDLPEGFKENLAKRRMKAEEEEYQELIKRSEEAVKLSDELAKKYSETNKLTNEDTRKIERLEKVVKKIRRDLGAEDDNDEEKDSPQRNLLSTLNDIKDKTSNLLAELKKTGRFSVSVVAIESSNAIFKLVRFLRFNKF